MEMTFTGRGVEVTDELRQTAEHKLSSLGRIEPRAVILAVEVISENHPKPNGTKTIEATLRIPRKTFRAKAEAEDVPTALDRVREKLERQLRDHHDRKRVPKKRAGLESAATQPPVED